MFRTQTMPAAARAVRQNAAINVATKSRVIFGLNVVLMFAQAILSSVAVRKDVDHYCDRPLWIWLTVWIVVVALKIPLVYWRFRLARAHRQGTQSWLQCEGWIRRFWTLTIIWIIFGQSWFFMSSDCHDTSPWVYNMTKATIILFYIELGLPLVILCLSCFCFPCLAVFLWLHEQYDAPVSEELQVIANQLPESVYHAAVPKTSPPGGCVEDVESPECSICCVPYVPGQTKICKLACTHMFDASCIKRWIHTNPTCPLCRAPVAQQEQREMDVIV